MGWQSVVSFKLNTAQKVTGEYFNSFTPQNLLNQILYKIYVRAFLGI